MKHVVGFLKNTRSYLTILKDTKRYQIRRQLLRSAGCSVFLHHGLHSDGSQEAPWLLSEHLQTERPPVVLWYWSWQKPIGKITLLRYSQTNLGGRIAQWIAFLLHSQQPRVWFSVFPKTYFLRNLFSWCCWDSSRAHCFESEQCKA